MSREVVLLCPRQMPTDAGAFQPEDCVPFGRTKEVRGRVDAVVPGIEWSTKSAGSLSATDCALEIHLHLPGDAGPEVMQIMLSFSAGSAEESVLAIIRKLSAGLSAVALDAADGELVHLG
ncbi:MAG TPA: hypothetical protein PKC45_18860 [Gemmatales bacterium]|nr:hypothetical protein [Gemmatales bacterium]